MSWQAVIAHYASDHQPAHVEKLGTAGGFSGAEFWRLTTAQGRLCLRRWPREHPSPQRLAEIHAVLTSVWRRGLRLVPRPLTARDGQTFVERDGHLWELTPWFAGQADYHQQPSAARLRAALRALASFHLAAVDTPEVPSVERRNAAPISSDTDADPLQLQPYAAHLTQSHGETSHPGHGSAPGIGQRLARLRSLLAGGLAELPQAVADNRARFPAFAERAPQLLNYVQAAAPTIEKRLAEVSALSVPLQPCIRDIWHDHVLFDGDNVTGLIDFGAMATDHVATDVARLLGSLVRDDPAGWEAGLLAYHELRPLSPDERRLLWAFDESSVLMSGLSWLEWIFRDERQFASPAAVLERVEENVARLATLVAASSSPRAALLGRGIASPIHASHDSR